MSHEFELGLILPRNGMRYHRFGEVHWLGDSIAEAFAHGRGMKHDIERRHGPL